MKDIDEKKEPLGLLQPLFVPKELAVGGVQWRYVLVHWVRL